MEHRATGWDTRWDKGHQDGMGGAGMEQEPLRMDMRQDRRSQEETVQEDTEHQDGTGGPGMGHKVTDGHGMMRMGWQVGQEVSGGTQRAKRGQEPLRCDTSHWDGT